VQRPNGSSDVKRRSLRLSYSAVPTGFKTDLASIPKALWSVLSPIGRYDAPAVLHDHCYQTGGVTGSDADATLNEAMIVCNVGRWTRWTIYAGVRSGGWVTWNRYRSRASSSESV
jgi:hypothetical protein